MNLNLLLTFTPEFVLVGLMAILFVLDLASENRPKDFLMPIYLAGLLALAAITIWVPHSEGTVLGGSYILDGFAKLMKATFVMTAFFVALTTRENRKNFSISGEFLLLISTALLGMMLLSGARDFISIFVSIELISISFYVMAAFLKKAEKSTEAGMKYLILGSLSTAIMIYGVSLLYGSSGSLQVSGILLALKASTPSLTALLGILMVFTAACFKIGLVPFHLWVPDVYEGAPLPVTAFLAAGSKIAGFTLLVILSPLFQIMPVQQWTILISVLAAASMFYGNLCAIHQTNAKRFLAYSGIAHTGYLIIGILNQGAGGVTGLLFYAVSYAIASCGIFLVLAICSDLLATKNGKIEALYGLSKRSPLIAAVLFVTLMSFAGVPPLAGFFAKYLILSVLVREGGILLALVGAVNVVISLYYYLVIVRGVYLEAPSSGTSPIIVSKASKIALIAVLGALVFLGFFQGPLFDLARLAN